MTILHIYKCTNYNFTKRFAPHSDKSNMSLIFHLILYFATTSLKLSSSKSLHCSKPLAPVALDLNLVEVVVYIMDSLLGGDLKLKYIWNNNQISPPVKLISNWRNYLTLKETMAALLPINFAGISPLKNLNHEKQTHLQDFEGVRPGKSMCYIGTTQNV